NSHKIKRKKTAETVVIAAGIHAPAKEKNQRKLPDCLSSSFFKAVRAERRVSAFLLCNALEKASLALSKLLASRNIVPASRLEASGSAAVPDGVALTTRLVGAGVETGDIAIGDFSVVSAVAVGTVERGFSGSARVGLGATSLLSPILATAKKIMINERVRTSTLFHAPFHNRSI